MLTNLVYSIKYRDGTNLKFELFEPKLVRFFKGELSSNLKKFDFLKTN